MPIRRKPMLKRRKPIRRMPRRKMGVVKRAMNSRASIPEHMRCKLSYYTGQIGATTTTTPATALYYINDIFDLKGDSSYAQPRFFDQMAALYQQYRVHAISWDFDFAPLSGSSYIASGCFPDQFQPTTAGKKTFEEDPRWRLQLSSTNRGPIKVKGFRSIAAIEDVPKRTIRDDDSYTARTDAAPYKKPQFRLGFQSVDETQSYGHWLNGKITFYVTFFQLKQPTAS